MKSIGCGLVVLGILALAGSFAMFGFAIKQSLEGKEVTSLPLEAGEPTQSDDIRLNPDLMGQLVVEVVVESTSVQEEKDRLDEDETDYELRYAFPLKYTVRGSDGQQLHYEDTSMAWDGGGRRSSTGGSVTVDGGTRRIKHSMGRFEVPDDGIVRIEAELATDTRYDATASEGRIHVYGDVQNAGESATGGMMMFCFGPVLVMTGIALVIVASVLRRDESLPKAFE